jgi:hypothetical protein
VNTKGVRIEKQPPQLFKPVQPFSQKSKCATLVARWRVDLVVLDGAKVFQLNSCLPGWHKKHVGNEWPEWVKAVHSAEHLVPQLHCSLDPEHDDMPGAQVDAICQAVCGDEVEASFVELLEAFLL